MSPLLHDPLAPVFAAERNWLCKAFEPILVRPLASPDALLEPDRPIHFARIWSDSEFMAALADARVRFSYLAQSVIRHVEPPDGAARGARAVQAGLSEVTLPALSAELGSAFGALAGDPAAAIPTEWPKKAAAAAGVAVGKLAAATVKRGLKQYDCHEDMVQGVHHLGHTLVVDLYGDDGALARAEAQGVPLAREACRLLLAAHTRLRTMHELWHLDHNLPGEVNAPTEADLRAAYDTAEAIEGQMCGYRGEDSVARQLVLRQGTPDEVREALSVLHHRQEYASALEYAVRADIGERTDLSGEEFSGLLVHPMWNVRETAFAIQQKLRGITTVSPQPEC